MYKIESLLEINRAGYDNAIKVATLSLEKVERLAKLNLSATKGALADGMETANAIAGVKDMPSLLAVNAALAEAGVETILGYSRGVYGIASEAQSEFSALAEEAWGMYVKEMTTWVDKASRNAPAGSDAAVTALKSTVKATTAAFDQFSKATKEVASFADASMRAATANAASIAKAATSYKKAA